MEYLNKIYKLILKIIEWLVIILTGGLVLIVFYNVISRYFLNNSVLWADEVSRFLFIFVSLFGCIIAQQKNEHMHLDVIVKLFPKKIGGLVTVLADVIVLIMLYVLVVGGAQYGIQNMDWKTSVLRIPFGWVYMMVPLAMTIFSIQYIIKIIIDIKSWLLSFKKSAEVSKGC